MPRIIPIQLLSCLRVLLDDNGGILSEAEVQRVSSLMTKYSKKLVSKCVYVQILKCTKTELLGEFMGVGGWNLVYNWLSDGIRTSNWPLVQEILELFLLCPVDVHRLRINAAPKLVKTLCRDGGNEGVRILARRLVEQWLKVVTDDKQHNIYDGAEDDTGAIPIRDTASSTSLNAANDSVFGTPEKTPSASSAASTTASSTSTLTDQDPLTDVANVTAPKTTAYTLTPAQKKANESGLVYKIVMKDGHQVLAKVQKTVPRGSVEVDPMDDEEEIVDEDREQANGEEEDEENESIEVDEQEEDEVDADDGSMDGDKIGRARERDETFKTALKTLKLDLNKSTDSGGSSSSSKLDKKERKSSRDSKDSKDRDREKDRHGDKDRKSSSSGGHKSSSSKSSTSHRSSSSSSKSRSSSSSHRSSSDKHRSSSSSGSRDKDKEREREHKERRESSSSSRHKSSNSKTSSSKDRHLKDKERQSPSVTGAAATKRDKDRERETQEEKDKDTLAKVMPRSLDSLGKIPKKPKSDVEAAATATGAAGGDLTKPTSIIIPSKKASISIEIRRDSEKAKTVKTYKSQFRSHGLTEEAPPPPSRKGLKKPASTTPAPGTVIPTSLPSSLKRSSPPPQPTSTSLREATADKKPKIDMSHVTGGAVEKPGAIKLIPPKKMQTLVETNIFSEALTAAMTRKPAKRKRLTTGSGKEGSRDSKEGPSPPVSPDGPKLAPLKFYQDTLDRSDAAAASMAAGKEESKKATEGDKDSEDLVEVEDDDDDIPLKKVKEDIEQKVLKEQKAESEMEGTDDMTSSANGDDDKEAKASGDEDTDAAADSDEAPAVKKPGPGCGPDGPPGVLMLHRRKGPKKKLSWRPLEQLEQIRYFEVDETERCNVTKTASFMDMKNMERFSERDAINMYRRGFNHEDNMAPQTAWRPLIEVDDVPSHPDGNQSKQRKIQAEREMTTLRALYFSHAMIPDSAAEAEIEPHYPHDIPIIPLDDVTGNPDAVNDFTSMPWPEPRGSPKHGDSAMGGTGGLGLGGLGSPADIFAAGPSGPANQYNPFSPFGGRASGGQSHMTMGMGQGGGGGGGMPPNGWQGPPPHGVPIGPPMGMGGMGPGGPPPNFMGTPPFVPNGGNGGAFIPPPFGPPGNFNGPNFGGGPPMGPPPGMLNGMGPGGPMGPMSLMGGGGGGGGSGGPPMGNSRNNSNNWRTGNFQDNSGGSWRTGSGPINRGGGGGGHNSGVCKAFMRGHCRNGKSCKYIHPQKSKRI